MKKYIPITLIYLRLISGIFILIFCLAGISHYPVVALVFLTFGLLSDIFDGIIARKIKISNEKLRRLDSAVDQAFFILSAVATYIQCKDFFVQNWLKLSILLGFEGLSYLICYIKFKKEIATHTIGAKIWTLLLFTTLVQIILTCKSNDIFLFCFWIGIVTRMEIIGIVFILKNWANDVPSIYHAIQIRNGKTIKHNKLFNR